MDILEHQNENKIEKAESELNQFLEYLDWKTTKGGRILQLNAVLMSVVVGLISYQGEQSNIGGLVNEWMFLGLGSLGISTILAVLTVTIGSFRLPIVSRFASDVEGTNTAKRYENAISQVKKRLTWVSYTIFGGGLLGFMSAPLLIAGFLDANNKIGFVFGNNHPVGAILFVILLPIATIGPIWWLISEEKENQ